MFQPPTVDKRTAQDIAQDVRRLLPKYVVHWPEKGRPAGAGDALIEVFARFGEIIIDRLNRVPEKNLLAFLDLFGVAPLPPQPARVPLTFFLVGQSPVDAVVPALTQVAAPPGKGEQDPTIFETETELVVTSVRLESLFSKDVDTDRYADYSSMLTKPASPGIAPFSGNLPMDHALYIGLDAFCAAPFLKRVTLSFALAGNVPEPLDPRSLEWEIWDGRGGIPLTPVLDETKNLTTSGDVAFTDLPPFPQMLVHGKTSGWLRCRCLTPIMKGSERKPGMLCEPQLPSVRVLTVRTELKREGLSVDRAFANLSSLDLTKDFSPFGDKPKFGDTFYLSCREAFSIPNARVTLHVKLTPPITGGAEPTTPARGPRAPKLRWEFWNGAEWEVLGDSERTGRVRIVPPGPEPGKGARIESKEFSDTTQALTENGDISFRLIEPVPQSTLNGEKGCWIRVRIISGDYGEEARYERDPAKGYVFVPATFSPPSISSVRVDYAAETVSAADTLLTYNDFTYLKASEGESFRPFEPTSEDRPSFYLGFTLLPGQTFSRRSMSVYFGISSRTQIEMFVDLSSFAQAPLTWEYWNGRAWTKWTVREDTRNLTRSGLVRFLAPSDFALKEEFGRVHYWLRARKENHKTQHQPGLRRVLLNTTMAAQRLTTSNETLGSSNGRPNQKFRTTRHPVLSGQQLEVLEPTMPPQQEQVPLKLEEGEDAISRVRAPGGRGEVWVRWHEVPNFYGSGPRDRHYVLNRQTGEVHFGDGTNGLIPPALMGNICMTRYQTGGGASGNKPALSIAQLKTTVPYVEKVVNLEGAEGGADAETVPELLDRAPRQIRHGWRAVAAEDFEDLAKLASREVARAKCVPLYDLAQDPDGRRRRPGVVSLILVPLSTDKKPLPSMELLERVRSFLDDHRLLTADLVLVGPEYIRIDVAVEVTVTHPENASEVELGVTRALARFLHPLTGRLDGTGWDFGRLPKESDLYGLIEGIPGVDHVRAIEVKRVGDRPQTEGTGRFLIYGGDPKVTLTLEE